MPFGAATTFIRACEPAAKAVVGEKSPLHSLSREAAIQVEKLGNQLAKTYDVEILCGYSLGSVQGGMDSRVFERVCAEHTAVYSR